MNPTEDQMKVAVVAMPPVDILANTVQVDGKEYIQVLPLDQYYELAWWNWEKQKYETLVVQFTAEVLEEIRQNTLEFRSGNPIPVFVNHDTYADSEGWVDPSTIKVHSIYGLVVAMPEWTNDDIQERIRTKKLRYISAICPWQEFDPRTGKQRGKHITEVTLTSYPYYIDQVGIAASGDRDHRVIIGASRVDDPQLQHKQEEEMDKAVLISMLDGAVPDDATDEQITAALKDLKGNSAKLKEISESLGVQDGEDVAAKVSEISEAASKATEEPDDKGGEEITDKGEKVETPADVAASANKVGDFAAKVIVKQMVASGQIPPKGEKDAVKEIAAMSHSQAEWFQKQIPVKVQAGGQSLNSQADIDTDELGITEADLEGTTLTMDDAKKYLKD